MDFGMSQPILHIFSSFFYQITRLPQNLASLSTAMEELKAACEDVKEQVRYEEKFQKRCSREVVSWINDVEAMEEEVNTLLAHGYEEVQKKCLGTCCPRCPANYKLGKMVREKIDVVTDLRRKANFSVVAIPLPNPVVVEIPLAETVGLDSLTGKVWRSLEDENVGTIGIWGMGGVGKTTLLKKINNQLSRSSHDFDPVIWVTVSKAVNVEIVQQTIRGQLGIPHYRWEGRSEVEKAAEIFTALTKRRFVLLIDDIWDRFDLLRVGIPSPNHQNRSKIVLTTRFANICQQMNAHVMIEVKCLQEEEAFALFQANVGQGTLHSHPDIQKLARVIAQECQGLPLALVTTGRAMAGRTNPVEWERTVHVLRNYPTRFPGMGDQLFPILEFSYDSLGSDTIKSCFLYCSLFPEDHEICCDQLIELWIGEGFLDQYDEIQNPRNKGEEIIESLKLSSLLETGMSQKYVKMHDLIRDMALWLACEHGSTQKFVVEQLGLIEAHKVSKWEEAQRISLWDSRFEELEVSSFFPCLETLLVCCKWMSCPSGLFQYMPIIRVLDLSKNFGLMELPEEIERLASLQYLNLSSTQIVKLPIQLQHLSNLRCLMLDEMHLLRIIPRQVISKLLYLKLFSIYNSMVTHGDCKVILKESACLEHLNEISISLRHALPIQTLLNTNNLRRSLRRLSLQDCTGMKAVQLSPHLQKLEISKCFELRYVKMYVEKEGPSDIIIYSKFHGQQYFYNLCEVEIVLCPRLLNLAWLGYARNLESLLVRNCASLERVLEEGSRLAEIEQDLEGFPRLKTLDLCSLPRLTSIYEGSLPFPSLREIKVMFCPGLRKLPFDTHINSLGKIRGEEEWWNGLEWEDEALKRTLSPCYVPVG